MDKKDLMYEVWDCILTNEHREFNDKQPYCKLYLPTHQRELFECYFLNKKLINVTKKMGLFEQDLSYWECCLDRVSLSTKNKYADFLEQIVWEEDD